MKKTVIEINERDLPITIAEKLISATVERDENDVAYKLIKCLGGTESDAAVDFLSVDDLKEIADYLYVYVNANGGVTE